MIEIQIAASGLLPTVQSGPPGFTFNVFGLIKETVIGPYLQALDSGID